LSGSGPTRLKSEPIHRSKLPHAEQGVLKQNNKPYLVVIPSHASTALSSTFSTRSKYTYHDDKEMEAEFLKLSKMIDPEEQAKQVKVLAKMYFDRKLRINLWAMHTPFGVRNRVKDFAVPLGSRYPVNWEYVTLNE
jgi:hypothetical protein